MLKKDFVKLTLLTVNCKKRLINKETSVGDGHGTEWDVNSLESDLCSLGSDIGGSEGTLLTHWVTESEVETCGSVGDIIAGKTESEICF